MTRIAQQRAAAAQQVRRKALQPEERFCRILRKPVTILVEYPDYHRPGHRGVEGEVYCSNIIECYQKNVECRYSGISPLYPDPFEGVPRDVREAEALFGRGEETGAERPQLVIDLSDLEDDGPLDESADEKRPDASSDDPPAAP